MRRFVIPDQFSRLRKIKEKIDEGFIIFFYVIVIPYWLFSIIKEKEIRQGIRVKRKKEETNLSKIKLISKQETENKQMPIKVESSNNIDLILENKKLLHKRLKTIKLEENPLVGFIIKKAKPSV